MLIFIADCFCVVFDFQVHFDCYLLHDGIYLCMKWHGREKKRKMLLGFFLRAGGKSIISYSAGETSVSITACLFTVSKAFRTSGARIAQGSLSTPEEIRSISSDDNHFPFAASTAAALHCHFLSLARRHHQHRLSHNGSLN